MFKTKKDSMRRKCYVFGAYKQWNEVSLVYLECQVLQDRYGWCISKLKLQKTVQRMYLETSKQQTMYRWCFLDAKVFREK